MSCSSCWIEFGLFRSMVVWWVLGWRVCVVVVSMMRWLFLVYMRWLLLFLVVMNIMVWLWGSMVWPCSFRCWAIVWRVGLILVMCGVSSVVWSWVAGLLFGEGFGDGFDVLGELFNTFWVA